MRFPPQFTAATKDVRGQMSRWLADVEVRTSADRHSVLVVGQIREWPVPLDELRAAVLAANARHPGASTSGAEPLLRFESNGVIISSLPLFLFAVLFGLSMHRRRQQHGADDRRVDEHGRGETDARLLHVQPTTASRRSRRRRPSPPRRSSRLRRAP